MTRIWMGRCLGSGIVLAAGALCASPTVSVTGVAQDPVSRQVAVTYELGEDAIVTAALSCGGGAIAAPRLYGDVNCVVSNGTRSFVWTPGDCDGGAVSFRVSAWNLADPPDYLVCDLDLGTVLYYATTNDLPGGIGSSLYRTSRLLMRRIPAAGQDFNCCNVFPMRLSRDFWMAVFETTQEQYRRVMGESPGAFTEATAWPTRPVGGGGGSLFYDQLRGDANATTVPDDPTSASFFGRLRAMFPTLPFDLPSEAQWDFAARAGSSAMLPPGVDSPLAVGRFAENGGLPAGADRSSMYVCGDTNGTARVGSYPHNAYGLYDTLGNVWEWCLDGYASSMGLSDPQTLHTDYVNRTVSSKQRVRRGGGWRDSISELSNSAYRSYWTAGLDNAGFRCACGGIAGTSRAAAQTDEESLAELSGDMVHVDTAVSPLERRIGTTCVSDEAPFIHRPAGMIVLIF